MADSPIKIICYVTGCSWETTVGTLPLVYEAYFTHLLDDHGNSARDAAVTLRGVTHVSDQQDLPDF